MNTPLFLLNLGLVVASLLATIVSGLRGNRPAHFRLVASTVVLLILAIMQAEFYGRGWKFEESYLNIHLFFSLSSLLMMPLVVYSGFKRMSSSNTKPHRIAVAVFVGLVLASVGTAINMFTTAVPVQ